MRVKVLLRPSAPSRMSAKCRFPEARIRSPTPLPQRAYKHSMPSNWSMSPDRICLFIWEHRYVSRTNRRGDPLASLHCIYFVVHMYARADAWNVTLFSSPHHVCFTLIPSYFARSRFAVAAADNVLARMAESQLMCNLTCPGDLRIHLYSLCARGHFVTGPEMLTGPYQQRLPPR